MFKAVSDEPSTPVEINDGNDAPLSFENHLKIAKQKVLELMKTCREAEDCYKQFFIMCNNSDDDSLLTYRQVLWPPKRFPLSQRQLFIEEWCELGVLNFIGKAVNYILPKTNDNVDDKIADLQNKIFSLEVAVTLTDLSRNASKLLADEIIYSLINLINDSAIKEMAFDWNQEDSYQNMLYALLLSSAINCIYNISRVPECRQELEEASAVEALKFYLLCKDSDMKITAFCAFAYILAESDSADNLLDSYGVIKEIVRMLHLALADSSHRHDGFSAEELAQSTAQLAVNDSNKAKLVDANIIPALQQMLAADGDELEQLRAVDCLWTLAFDEDIRHKINKTDGLCLLVEQLSRSAPNKSLKRQAEQAFEFLKYGKDGLSNRSDEAKEHRQSDGHVFISYSWKQQDTVLKLRQLLLDAGYKVWIDVDLMRGCTLESMASAVENASVILICYSESYRLSNNCRCEAEYAFKLGKPFIPVNMQYRYQPTGWLGIIIGTKLYFDFSMQKHPFDKVAPKLMSELVLSLKGTNEESTEEVYIQKNSKTNTQVTNDDRCCRHCKLLDAMIISNPSSGHEDRAWESEKLKVVRSWTNQLVSDWLRSENLEHLGSRFSSFDGQALLGLYLMKFSVVDLYYKSLMQLVGDSFLECVNVTAALDKLFSN